MNRPAFLLCAVLLQAGSPAAAGDGPARLDAFLRDTMTLSADFVQILVGETRAGARESRGLLWVARPGRFRWDYAAPYRQLIVGDGTKLWIYDPDLEQVTVRGQDQALGSSPAQLLSGGVDLAAKFEIDDAGEDGGVAWVEIRPRGGDDEFASMRLGFTEDGLHAMRMTDNLGNITEINFNKLKTNIDVDPSLFVFLPPPGVDVVGE